MLNANDPLVPVPITLERYVSEALGDDPDRDIMELMSRYFEDLIVRMPGFDSVGNPLVPPDSHILDHLARVWDLVDTEIAEARPTAGTVANPVDDCECDLCGNEARYETRTGAGRDREVIYACLDCMRAHGEPILGSGASVYLMFDEEIPAAVRRVCDEIRAKQGLGSIWADEINDVPVVDPVAELADPVPVILTATAVSVRLRALWMHRIGPLLEEHDHDLGDNWRDATVRRVGSRLVVGTPINFGDGNPFNDETSEQVRELIVQESSGVVTTVEHEYAGPTVARQRRPKANSLDVFSPGDLEALDPGTFAEKLSAALAGTTPEAKAVLGKLTVAGTSRHRLWLAVPVEADRQAIVSTPGATGALVTAIARLQEADPLYDVVVDPAARQRYSVLDLD